MKERDVVWEGWALLQVMFCIAKVLSERMTIHFISVWSLQYPLARNIAVVRAKDSPS
jgi:hypothetical protein